MKSPRRPRKSHPATLADQRLILLDRAKIAWQDHQGTWRGNREDADTRLTSDAPAGFHVNAVLQPDEPYLWIGIAAFSVESDSEAASRWARDSSRVARGSVRTRARR